uniref:Uncharacterized protein n=1 Tax=Arundo donax TaxID=35708 RepID=A0A0A9CY32_ARUDO
MEVSYQSEDAAPYKVLCCRGPVHHSGWAPGARAVTSPNGATSGNATPGHQGYAADPAWTGGGACSRLDRRVITGGCGSIWGEIRLDQKGSVRNETRFGAKSN